MKKVVFGLLFLGLASLGYCQEPKSEAQQVALEGVTVISPNFSYLTSVQDENTPATVRVLERKAASFNLKKSPIYNQIDEAYEVFFSNSKGRIVATYDNDGKILSSFEKFGDVVLPVPVRNTIFESYPNWKINSNAYAVSYYRDKGVKKTYHFQISKEDLKQNLKLTLKGWK
ncbi:MAG: hypothetical protein WBM53_03905 [Maribacter sp.]